MKSVEELRGLLEGMFGEGINLQLYLGIDAPERRTYFLADLEDDTTQSICESHVNSVRRDLADEDLSTIQLSQLDQRAKALVYYDAAESPIEFANLLTVRDAPDPPLFSFSEHQFNEVKAS